MPRLAVALLGALLAACSGRVAPIVPPQPSANPAPAHAVIPLGINTGTKIGFHVSLSVGGASQRNVLFDTGSSGLWIYPNAIGRYAATPYEVRNRYGSGIEYDGHLVYATVSFGNGLTTAVVPVALVDRATCVKNEPSCPATPSPQHCPGVKHGPNEGILCLEVGRKLFGTFGAALAMIPVPSKKPVTEMYNVLFGIAQPWAASFVVTPAALELGPYSTDGFAMIPMTAPSPAPARPAPSGARGWNRDVSLCFSVGTLRNYCAPTLFDTGASNVDFQASVKLPLVRTPCGDRVKKGTPFDMRTQDGTVLGSFNAGDAANWNAVEHHKQKKHPQINTGLTFYNRDEILFDAANGRVGLRRLATPGRTARSGCQG